MELNIWDFELKHFGIRQFSTAMKVGTDSISLGAWTAHAVQAPNRILDLGTGTGILALMMAQSYPSAKIDAIELEDGAYQDAYYNISNSIFGKRISLHHADAISFSYRYKYDLIISNPPYYTADIYSSNRERHIARFDRQESGLGIRTLIQIAQRLLDNSGVLSFIAPYNRLNEIRQLAAETLFVINHLCILESYPGEPVRIMLILSKQRKTYIPTQEQILSIRTASGEVYTSEYRSLVSEFLCGI
jgi:ribosomal protein L11 methyltransferase (prmA)